MPKGCDTSAAENYNLIISFQASGGCSQFVWNLIFVFGLLLGASVHSLASVVALSLVLRSWTPSSNAPLQTRAPRDTRRGMLIMHSGLVDYATGRHSQGEPN